MASPLSHVLASIFIEEFEVCMLRRSTVAIHLWTRYVDDTLIVVERGKEEELLGHLIQLTGPLSLRLKKKNTVPFGF